MSGLLEIGTPDAPVLRKYAKEPIALNREWTYPQSGPEDRRNLRHKPNGFWVSVLSQHENDIDWADFCRGEDFNTDQLAVEHEVVMDSAARILHLSGRQDLLDFIRQYGYAPYADLGVDGGLSDYVMPDWPRVAGEYQGIVIAPYVWSARLTVDYYYPWDCASGAIWDLDAIREIRVLSDQGSEQKESA